MNNVAFIGRLDAMVDVRAAFDSLDNNVRDFPRSPHHEDALYPDKVQQWRDITLVSSENL